MIEKVEDAAGTEKTGEKGKSNNRKARQNDADLPGLTVERYFTRKAVDPFSEVEWTRRDAVISGPDGTIYFEQRGCEVPVSWSQTATNVVAQKYFRGTLGTPERESSVRQMIARVSDTIFGWGRSQRYFRTDEDARAFRDELTHLLLHQKMAFNSPVWFNVGVEEHPQCSACFINSVEDSMESILSLARTEGMLFKYGSGTGSNLSSIRSSKELLNGGGTASGPVSFMNGFDAFAGAIKSGGKTRRAAKMVILNIDHPDVLTFIECKAREEKKAWSLIDAGYDGNFNVAGGAYDTVGYQNANHSVRVTDDFMNAVLEDRTWTTRAVTDAAPVDAMPARSLFRAMAEAAHICGDPGIQFDTTINKWHPCINTARINASNPCSEYMFLDDSACNLASLNLRKFQKADGEFDVESYRRAIEITIIAMEIIVGSAKYPTEKIRINSIEYRPLGLGYANLGALLMSRGVPYDSDPGRAYAAALTSILCGHAYATSARIAGEATGPFSGYAKNTEPMARVMRQHRAAVDTHIDDALVPYDLMQAARECWDQAIGLGSRYGYRNGQATVLAPTGTIGFLMDCDTTGIEPDIALVKYKKLVGGGMLKIVNQTVPEALTRLGYSEPEVKAIVEYIDSNETIEGAPALKPEHLAVFDCAFRSPRGTRSIHYMGHVRMMAATQPFLSGAISKTVNLPNDCTVEDIEDAYREAWRMGLKAIAVYRDGCKRTQPLSTSREDSVGQSDVDRLDTLSDDEKTVVKAMREAAGRPVGPPTAIRYRLSPERRSLTHKFSIAGHEGYVTVGLYEDGRPGEIFVRMAKEGSVIAGLMDSFATAVSLALQHGVPLRLLAEKFKGTRFEPAGFTGNQEIPIATSIMDYLFRWLALRFLNEEAHPSAALHGDGKGQLDLPTIQVLPAQDAGRPIVVEQVAALDRGFVAETDAPICHECGTLMYRSGACHKCPNCGATSGCS
jgi:ribonucleoside-diphosphate reductase alpha chain